jgi:hypothetical protein
MRGRSLRVRCGIHRLRVCHVRPRVPFLRRRDVGGLCRGQQGRKPASCILNPNLAARHRRPRCRCSRSRLVLTCDAVACGAARRSPLVRLEVFLLCKSDCAHRAIAPCRALLSSPLACLCNALWPAFAMPSGLPLQCPLVCLCNAWRQLSALLALSHACAACLSPASRVDAHVARVGVQAKTQAGGLVVACDRYTCNGHGACLEMSVSELDCVCDSGYETMSDKFCGSCAGGYYGYPNCHPETVWDRPAVVSYT